MNLRPALSAMLLAACAFGDRVVASRPEKVPIGQWGGEHVRLDVAEEGARIEFDCAHGSIDAPLDLDADGRFRVKGTFVREQGGPVHKDEAEDREPAVFSGQTDGRTMDLKVTLEGGAGFSSFRLAFRQRGKLVKCR
jgi:hypothetical protein